MRLFSQLQSQHHRYFHVFGAGLPSSSPTTLINPFHLAKATGDCYGYG